MKTLIIISFTMMCLIFSLSAQQSMIFKHNYDNQFYQNPAATSLWNETSFSLNYNKVFEAERAPTNFLIGGQYSLDEEKSAIGGYILSERAGLLSQNQIGVTYSYKLLLGDLGSIALGLGANLNNLSFDGANTILIHESDPYNQNLEKGFGLNVQMGAVYSNSNQYGGRNAKDHLFSLGLGMSKIANRLNLNTTYVYEQTYQVNSFVRYSYMGNQDFIITPMAEVNYDGFHDMYLNISCQATLMKVFSASISLDNAYNAGCQLGYILKNGSSNSGTQLNINFNLPFNNLSQYTEPGYGISIVHMIHADGNKWY